MRRPQATTPVPRDTYQARCSLTLPAPGAFGAGPLGPRSLSASLLAGVPGSLHARSRREQLGDARGVHGAVVGDEVPGRLVRGEQLAAPRDAFEERDLGEHLGPPRATGKHAGPREPAGRGRARPRIDEVVTPRGWRAPDAPRTPGRGDGAGTQAHVHHRPAGEWVLEVDDPAVVVG